MLSTFITFRHHFHFSVIGDALTQDSRRTSTLLSDYTEALAAKTSGGAPVNHMQAPAEMANVVRREAFVIAKRGKPLSSGGGRIAPPPKAA